MDGGGAVQVLPGGLAWILSQLKELKLVLVELSGGCRGGRVRLLGTGKLEGSTYSLGQGLHLVLLPPQEPVAFCRI